jgi:hypothetical protein
VPFVFRHVRVHPIPLPTFVTIAKRPSCGSGTGKTLPVICPTRQAQLAATHWHDGQISHGGSYGRRQGVQLSIVRTPVCSLRNGRRRSILRVIVRARPRQTRGKHHDLPFLQINLYQQVRSEKGIPNIVAVTIAVECLLSIALGFHLLRRRRNTPMSK